MSKTEPAEAPLLPFRIHFEDGRTEDVMAASADAARAMHKTFGTIKKIKIIREK